MPDARAERNFFSADPATLARRLLGRLLIRTLDDGTRLSGVIVETEAYLGVEDRAAHSYGGRRTGRNEPMYGRPGLAYVYFTYGMHHCFNVVCGAPEEPVAVLIRALEPLEGLEEMRELRGHGRNAIARARIKDSDLCSGPGKLCAAMAIDRELSGADLVSDPRLFLGRIPVRRFTEGMIVRTPRIGVDYAGEWAARPLRFVVSGSAHASVRNWKRRVPGTVAKFE